MLGYKVSVRRSPRRSALVAAVAALILILCSCGASSATPRAKAPGPAPAGPSTGSRASDLSARVVLDSTQVRAGTPIKGWLVVTNRTHHRVGAPPGCAISYEVVLTNPSYHPMVAWPAVCAYNGRSAISFEPGDTKMAVTVATTYLACSGQQAAGSTTPVCGSGGQLLPPLPAGVYYTELVSDGGFLPPCPPVQVTLLSPARPF